MIRILLLSDLHMEFGPQKKFMDNLLGFDDAIRAADVIVLAGDIKTGVGGVQWANTRFPSNKPVIYALGNHEFYHGDLGVLKYATESAANKNIHVLNPGVVTLDGYNFIGCTLWSQARIERYPNTTEMISRCISDFRVITNGVIDRFNINLMCDINKKESAFIENQLNTLQGVNIVVTHFLPSQECCAPKYVNDPLTPYFINDLDHLVAKADLWLYGHTHERQDQIHSSGTRMVCNPLGYPNEHGPDDNYTPIIIEMP